MKNKKRYQECNIIVKFFRNLHYLRLLYHLPALIIDHLILLYVIKNYKIEDYDLKWDYFSFKENISILIGLIEYDYMNYYFTLDECEEFWSVQDKKAEENKNKINYNNDCIG